MRFARRTVLVTAAILGGSTMSLAQPESASPPLTGVSDGRTFTINDGRGHLLAIHFLGAFDTPENSRFVRDYLAKAPSVAGVRHIFASAGDREALRAWAAQFGDDARAIYQDIGWRVASSLKVGSANDRDDSATVVLDAAGHEIFRHEGKAHDDHLGFDEFVRQITERTKAPALAHYNLPRNGRLAVEGYDVVAYFTASKAVRGRPELASEYRGVTYHFSTADNRSLFAADPEKYLPTYGGWCASAMGDKGTKVEIDPKNFKVKGGRLFLFYKSAFGDALKDWNRHEKDWEPAADANWKKLTNEDPVKPSK